jgi:hypothetical protein
MSVGAQTKLQTGLTLTRMARLVSEISFVVEEAPEGDYVAQALGASIFIETDDLESLHERVRAASNPGSSAPDIVLRNEPAYVLWRMFSGRPVPTIVQIA